MPLMLARVSIRAKILAAVILPAALAAALALNLALTARNVDRAYAEAMGQDITFALQIERTRGDLADLGQRVNSMLLSRNPGEARMLLVKALEAEKSIREGLHAARSVATAARGSDLTRVDSLVERTREAVAKITPQILAGDFAGATEHFRRDGLPQVTAAFDDFARIATAVKGEVDARALAIGAAASRQITWSLALLGLALLLGLGAGGSVAVAGIARPLAQLAGRMRALAGGDKTAAVPGLGRRDELGGMAGALEEFRAAAVRHDEVLARDAAEQAARARRVERVTGLIQSFEAEVSGALQGVAQASSELDTTAGEMESAATGGNQRAAALAATSNQASTNVQTVANAAEEMAASVAEVARQVGKSAGIAHRAAEDARATDAAVGELSEAAGRIGEVVRLIEDIAGKTNLLALNATIEAARAGEHGKGFAVVASEVKTLAAQTARATEEIGRQIAAIQAETGRAVETIRGIAHTVEAMQQMASQVAASAEEQAAATQEIGRAVAEAAVGTRDVSCHAAGVADGAMQTGVAASRVRSASAELSRQAGTLKDRIGGFLAGIRAA